MNTKSNTKYQLLRDYSFYKTRLDTLVQNLDLDGCPQKEYEQAISSIKERIAKLEKTDPWLVDVRKVIEGT